MNGPCVGTAANTIEVFAVPQSDVARTLAVPGEVAASVTSATPPTMTFETDGRPVSRKKPRSVVKKTEAPSATGVPAFVTVARMITADPASGVYEVAASAIATLQVP